MTNSIHPQMEPFAVIGQGGMGMAKEGLEYTILVVTGWKGPRRNTAKVHMRLYGTKDSSPVIPLDDGVRQVRVYYCNDPAGNAGKLVLRMVTQMSVWGQCVHRSWHAIQCVWNIGEFSPCVEVPTSDPGGQVWCQMSNRSYLCQQGTQKVMCFIYLYCVSRFRYSSGYVKFIKRPQHAAAHDQRA